MLICSIDVGIKNLSFCLFEVNNNNDKENINILEWSIVNLSEKYELLCNTIDKNDFCGKKAKYSKNNMYYCLKHSKKEKFIIPNKELKLSNLKKLKLFSLNELAKKYNINSNNKKKQELLDDFNNFISNNCLEEIKKVNATKIDLVNIGKNIQYKFDKILENYIEKLNFIIIENQIGPIANKMKTIQGMIAQYFIMKNNNIKIEFINASNKLKDTLNKDKFNEYNNFKKEILIIDKIDENLVENEEKLIEYDNLVENEILVIEENDNIILEKKIDYKTRKKLSINTTFEILNNSNNFKNWITILENSKKKDDLCDCFLQGLYFIKYKL